MAAVAAAAAQWVLVADKVPREPSQTVTHNQPTHKTQEYKRNIDRSTREIEREKTKLQQQVAIDCPFVCPKP